MNNQRGITLMVVLVMLAVIGLAAAMAGQSWTSLMQQEREAELLWRGDQYRKAIASYFTSGAQGTAALQAYPQRLEDLLRDPRSLATKRHLRRLYPDPMTGEPFEIIKDPGGRLVGVRSAGEEEPFKKDGFAVEYEEFKDAESYAKWEFRYKPPTVRPGGVGGNTPGGGGGAGGDGNPGGPGRSGGATDGGASGGGLPGSIPAPKPGGGNPFNDQGWPEGWTPWKMPGK